MKRSGRAGCLPKNRREATESGCQEDASPIIITLGPQLAPGMAIMQSDPLEDSSTTMSMIREDMIDRITTILRTLPTSDLPGILHALARFERASPAHHQENQPPLRIADFRGPAA